MPRRCISCATCAISSSDGVMSPESPTRSAPRSTAVSRIFCAGTITPRSTTSKLLHWSTTPTMFLPMSCTSPLTVAITTSAFGLRRRSRGRLLRLDERDEMRHRLLHHARALHDLRQEHLARAEEIADDVHPGHQRALDHLDRACGAEPRLLGVVDDVGRDAADERMGESLLHGARAPGQVFGDRLALRLHGLGEARRGARSRPAGDSGPRPRHAPSDSAGISSYTPSWPALTMPIVMPARIAW